MFTKTSNVGNFRVWGQLIATIQSKGIKAFVRVGENNNRIIKRVLDAGADGIIVPMVNTKEEAQKAEAEKQRIECRKHTQEQQLAEKARVRKEQEEAERQRQKEHARRLADEKKAEERRRPKEEVATTSKRARAPRSRRKL